MALIIKTFTKTVMKVTLMTSSFHKKSFYIYLSVELRARDSANKTREPEVYHIKN